MTLRLLNLPCGTMAYVSDYPHVLIRARCLTGYRALLREHGADGAALLAASGIAADALDAPDTLVSLTGVMALFNATAVFLDAPDFGLQLAQRQDINMLGPVGLIAQHAATFGDALAAIARNMPYHTPGLLMQVDDDPARPGFTQCQFALKPATPEPAHHVLELVLNVAERFFLDATGGEAHDWHVSLGHTSTLSPAQYGRYFHSQLVLRQRSNALSFPSRLLRMALAPEDALLQAAAERHVNNVLRRFPLDLPQQVEAVVRRHLADGSANLVTVALHMGVHERTLQRRLKNHGLLFEDIVDRVRRSRAEQYLLQSAIPLAELAAMLGYSEQSSFIRGCRRWFGMTPQAFRDQRHAVLR